MSGIFGTATNIPIAVWDEMASAYVAADKYQLMSPMTDIDTTYTYNGDGTIATAVLVGLGHTKTMVFTWAGGLLQSIATVIT